VALRVLFATYCIELAEGQLQIGAYKRGLRVGLALSERGHEVLFYCTGHNNFHDDLTAQGKRRMRFLDFPFRPAAYEGAEANRASFLAQLGELQPDLIVIGETPMAGPMLEMTLCAVEAKIPVVFLDNAYHPSYVGAFCEKHGAMADGIVLSGPSALYGSTSYRYVTHVPPYMEASPSAARALLRDELGMNADRLMVVLAYDPNVERLGISLLTQLDDPDLAVVFVSPDPAGVQRRVAASCGVPRGRVRAIAPPTEPVLFGLLQLARCAVTKCAYMQVTESLSLGTPVVSLYYPGFFSLSAMPSAIKPYTHATTTAVADPATLAAARRFLHTDAEELGAVHDGTLGAADRVADFLEALPRTPRADAAVECARLGFTTRRIRGALLALHPGRAPVVLDVRSNCLREFPDHAVHVVVCRYALGEDSHFVRLWGRVFHSARALFIETRRIRAEEPRRRVLYTSLRARILLELDMGEEVLPSIVEMMARRRLAADG